MLGFLWFSLLAVGVWGTQAIAASDYNLKCEADKLSRTNSFLCLDARLQLLDRAIHITHGKILKEFDSRCLDGEACVETRKKLTQSQSGWLAYRDSYCELETIYITNLENSDRAFVACLTEETILKLEALHILKLNLRGDEMHLNAE